MKFLCKAVLVMIITLLVNASAVQLLAKPKPKNPCPTGCMFDPAVCDTGICPFCREQQVFSQPVIGLSR